MSSDEASTPVTFAPRRASGSASSPAPQPTSSAVLPSSGRRTRSSHCQCWSIMSRIYLSRTGFNLCSIASGPSGIPPVAGVAGELPDLLGQDARCRSGQALARACLHHVRPLTGRRPQPKDALSSHAPHRDEIRRHVDGGYRAHPSRRRAGQTRGRARQPARGRGLGDGGRNRSPRPALQGSRAALRPARI